MTSALRAHGTAGVVLTFVLVAGATLVAALGGGAAQGEAGAPPVPLLVTVDDLPIAGGIHDSPADRERITRGLLDALARHKIRAVGMVTWANVKHDSDLDLLEMWLRAGHELGNHSFNHLDYSQTDAAAYIADIEAGRAALATFLRDRHWGRGADGVWRQAGDTTDALRRVRWFRFPFLREGDTIEKLLAMRRHLAESGQRNLHVTIDDQDWSFETPWVEARRRGDRSAMARLAEDYQSSLRLEFRCHEEESERLFERVPPQVLLVHANEIGAAQWESLFSWAAAHGHRFATVDEVLADPAFAAADACEFVSRYGGSLWFRIADCRRRDSARDAVEKLLRDQAAAWNRGDLEAFCSVYAEDATFVSPSGTSQGRAMILDRYRKKYPDQAAMGTLTLEVMEGRAAGGPEVSMLGDAMPSRIHSYSVAARWTLSYPQGGPETRSGMTLLVLQRTGDAWKIVQDASM